MTVRYPPSGTRGFTLVELVLVLGLLAVVAGIAAPQLRGFVHGREVREELRRALSLVHWAQEEAISRGVRMTVWFDSTNASYGVRPEAGSPDGDELTRSFQLKPTLTLRFDPELADEHGQASIVCWPDGSIDADSARRVEYVERDGRALALVRDVTGMRYRVEEVRG